VTILGVLLSRRSKLADDSRQDSPRTPRRKQSSPCQMTVTTILMLWITLVRGQDEIEVGIVVRAKPQL
jgi:hypothetical protein